MDSSSLIHKTVYQWMQDALAPMTVAHERILYFDHQDLKTINPRSYNRVFANLILYNKDSIIDIFTEFKRVLRTDGLFIFSSLGPDSLQNLRCEHEYDFLDMHHVGDALIQAGFVEPVIERDNLDIRYKTQEQCEKDIRACLPQCQIDVGILDLHFEVIIGHAWCLTPSQAHVDGTVSIPIESIKKNR